MTEVRTGLTPLAFTRVLVDHLEHLSHARVTEEAIDKAKSFLRERRALRKKRPKKERGYEYVAELVFRPTITQYAKSELGIKSNSHRHIYSSHFHTTRDREKVWRARWQDFKRAHPDVDTDDDGHSRRADLFIAMGKKLVSIEFKYLRAKSKPAAHACVSQIRQHLTKHRACVLVLYAAMPVSGSLESTAGKIRHELRGRNGFVVVMTGHLIEFP